MLLKQTKYIAQISLLVIAIVTLSSPSLLAMSFDVTHVEANDHLNMRSAPGVSNTVVTTIPANATQIEYLGKDIQVGKTTWSMIDWQGSIGWVSKYYLVPSVTQDDIQTVAKLQKVVPQPVPAPTVKSAPIKNVVVKAERPAKKDGTWVLRCGNKSPFWQVDIHPKWMKLQQGNIKTGLIITKKKQDRNRWNTAIKTIVHGQKGRNSLKLTIKYAYSKRCYDTLTGKRVPYKVMTEFNGEAMSGCCYAIQLSASDSEVSSTIASR